MRLALLLPLALFIAACSGTFTDPYAGTELPVELRIDSSRRGEPQTPTAVGGQRQMTITGQLMAGDPCQTLSAVARWNGRGELVLKVTATAKGVPCIAVVGVFPYTATVRDLAPGTYRLVVMHATEATDRRLGESRALETIVVVR